MARQSMAGGFPFSVFVNETQTAQRMGASAYFNEVGSSGFVVAQDWGAAVNWGADLYQATANPVGLSSSAQRDAATSVGVLAGVAGGQPSPVEWSGSLVAQIDVASPLEWLRGQSLTPGAPIELGAAVQVQRTLPAEFLTTALASPGSPTEWLAGVFAHRRFHNEALSGVTRDQQSPLERLITVLRQVAAAIEWAGSRTVRSLVLFIRSLRS